MTTTTTTTTTTDNIVVHHQKSFEPEDTSEYKKQSYWDRRFEMEEEFDWLGTWEDLRPSIEHLLLSPPSSSSSSTTSDNDHDNGMKSEEVKEEKEETAELLKQQQQKRKSELRILVLGCGNSTLSHDLYQSGYTNIVSMDYSSVVIQKMQHRYPMMHWVVMDVLDMSSLDAGSFDLVLDKGVMDALVTDETDQWSPNVSMTRCMCQQVYRLLRRDGGMFVQVSFAQPHFRRLHLIPETMDDEQEVKTMSTPKYVAPSENVIGWSFEWLHLPTVGFGYYVFIMRRNDMNQQQQ